MRPEIELHSDMLGDDWGIFLETLIADTDIPQHIRTSIWLLWTHPKITEKQRLVIRDAFLESHSATDFLARLQILDVVK